MEQLISISLAVALFGGVYDLLTKRIPNWWTFPMMVVGIVAQILVYGFLGLGHALLGIGFGFILFFPIYAFGYMGAGDVKLLMAVGAFVGWKLVLVAAIISIIVGGIFALIETAYRGRLFYVLKRTFYVVRALVLPGLVPEPLKIDESRKFAFGLCIAASLVVIGYMQITGRAMW
ncbi:MAG: A24 family peptidase [Oligoflexia bacterium]|nr:A24 family peptidase [Oligoflexia bacterium]